MFVFSYRLCDHEEPACRDPVGCSGTELNQCAAGARIKKLLHVQVRGSTIHMKIYKKMQNVRLHANIV